MFDLLFAEPSDPQSDGYFAAAIATASAGTGSVILAADTSTADPQNSTRLAMPVRVTKPLPLFTKAGARVGFAGVQIDPDLVVRRDQGLTDRLPSLAAGRPRQTNGARLIRYPALSAPFRQISYYEFFTDQPPSASLAGKTVFIGFDLKAAADIYQHKPDNFATPLTRFTGQQPDRGLASCLVRLGPVRLAGMQRDETVFALLEHPLAADQQAALARTLARTLGHREAAEGQ